MLRATAVPMIAARPLARRPIQLLQLWNRPIANNLFDELPPALAAATSLTELSLAGNAQLALTAADADLLLRLPSLRRLSLHQTSTPEHVLRWLRHLCT